MDERWSDGDADADAIGPSAFPGPAPEVVFLHIPKTGGTALRACFDADAALTGRRRFELLTHRVTIADAATGWPGSGIGFVIRDPVERLVSAFLSRLRMGRPRYDSPWRPAERTAFERFPTPDALGRGLAVGDPAALVAVERIRHLRDGLGVQLIDVATLERLRDRIVVIGRTETLDADVQRLRVRAGLDARAVLPTDAVAAHRSPPDAPRALSPAADGAFRALCRDDEPIVAWCRARRRELLGEDEPDDLPRALRGG